jgi:hypothetical protein
VLAPLAQFVLVRRHAISDARSFEIEIGPHGGSRSTVLASVSGVNTLSRQTVSAVQSPC